MKILVKFLLILTLLIHPAIAETYNILTLPTDLLSKKENYYNFDEMSEIIASDIIVNLNNTSGKIKSPTIYNVKTKLNQNQDLKQQTENALKKYKESKYIDYQTFKQISKKFESKYILIVSSYTTTNKNSITRGVWETLEIASNFEIIYPFRLETTVVLIDTENEIVMWSNSYSTKLGTNENLFQAANYTQAHDWLEKMKLYSNTIAAPSTSQNIVLRFYPKAIRPIEQNITPNSGGALKFDKNIPEKPKSNNSKNDDFFGEMIYGI